MTRPSSSPDRHFGCTFQMPHGDCRAVIVGEWCTEGHRNVKASKTPPPDCGDSGRRGDLVTNPLSPDRSPITPDEARAQIEGMSYLPDPKYQAWLSGRNKLRDIAGLPAEPHQVPPHIPGFRGSDV